ncbi:MAG TPA: hypothetical protein VGQ55_07190 [Pyrinomonadaceae bacterium]|jgi:hypothetical protein|nr:hypothetical protein [Pyrinomonadaceae bacterium]
MKLTRSSLYSRIVGSAAILIIGGLASCSLPRQTGNTSEAKPIATSTPAATLEKLGNVTHNGITLNANMSDDKILKAFGMATDTASKDVARGPDGFSNTYKLGKQIVSITRSVSTGNNVTALGPIEGDWKLGMPDETK